MAGVAGGGIIWDRVELVQKHNDGTGTGDAQVGRRSCAKVRRTVSEDRARDRSPIRGKSDKERGEKGGQY